MNAINSNSSGQHYVYLCAPYFLTTFTLYPETLFLIPSLSIRELILAYDAGADGWDAITFHNKVDNAVGRCRQADPGLKAPRFQSLFVKRIHSAFNLNLVSVSLHHYSAGPAVLIGKTKGGALFGGFNPLAGSGGHMS